MSSSNAIIYQMSARGLQDVVTHLNPDLSLWRKKHKKIANFAIDDPHIDAPTARWGREVIGTIPRAGDLLRDMHLQIDINPVRLADPGPNNDTVNFTNVLGNSCFEDVTLRMGHVTMEQIYGQYIELMHEYEHNRDKKHDSYVMRADNKEELIEWSNYGNAIDADGNRVIRLFIKLPFWFTHSNTLALPICALEFSVMHIGVNLRPKQRLLQFSNPNNTRLDEQFNGEIKKMDFVPQFVYVEDAERDVYLNKPAEFVIQQSQRSTYHVKAPGQTRLTVDLQFNHPIKYLLWVVQRDEAIQNNEYYDYSLTGYGDDPFLNCSLRINRADRVSRQSPEYYRIYHPIQFFQRKPERPQYCFSFAMFADSKAYMPSGTINASRLEDLSLVLELPTHDGNGERFGAATVTVFTSSFNIVSIADGAMHIRFAT